MAHYYDADGDYYNLSMSKDYAQLLADEAAKGVYASPALLKQYEDYHNAKVDYLGYNNSIDKSYVYNDSPDGSIVHNYVPTGNEKYDPNVDYSALIAQEAAKGTGANRAQLAEWEILRNAKIAGQGLEYDPTYKFSTNPGDATGGNNSNSNTSGGDGGGYSGGGGYYSGGGSYGGYYSANNPFANVDLSSAYAAVAQANALQNEYDRAVSELRSNEAIENRNLNEWFNAQGLNTGTAGQMQLANRNATAEALGELQREFAPQMAAIQPQANAAQGIIDMYEQYLAAQQAMQEQMQQQLPSGGSSGSGGYIPPSTVYGNSTPTITGGNTSRGSGGGTQTNTGTGVTYDPSVDYQALINEELAKGSGADAALLKQLEQQRNAKIAGEGITEYGQTNYYQNGYTPSGSGGGSRGNSSGGANTPTSRPAGNNGASYAGGNVAVSDSGYYGSNDSGPSRNYDILQSQLSSIPGLTEENKIAIIDDAVRNHRISPAEGIRLQNYLGY